MSAPQIAPGYTFWRPFGSAGWRAARVEKVTTRARSRISFEGHRRGAWDTIERISQLPPRDPNKRGKDKPKGRPARAPVASPDSGALSHLELACERAGEAAREVARG